MTGHLQRAEQPNDRPSGSVPLQLDCDGSGALEEMIEVVLVWVSL
jgi:hypothetical protein